MSDKVNVNPLQYYPLSMFKSRPKDFGNHAYELRNHVGRCSSKKVKRNDDLPLPDDSYIAEGKAKQPHLLF